MRLFFPSSWKSRSCVALAALLVATPIFAEIDAGHYYCSLREHAESQAPSQRVRRIVPDEVTAANIETARICREIARISEIESLQKVYNYLFRSDDRLTGLTAAFMDEYLERGFMTREWADGLLLYHALDDIADGFLTRLASGGLNRDSLSEIVSICAVNGSEAMQVAAPEDLSPYASPDDFVAQFANLSATRTADPEFVSSTVEALLSAVEEERIITPNSNDLSRELLGRNCETYTGKLAAPLTRFTDKIDCRRLNDVVVALSFHYPAYLSNVGQDDRTRARYESEYGFGQEEMSRPVHEGAACWISAEDVSDRVETHVLTCRTSLPTLAKTPAEREAEVSEAMNSFRLCFSASAVSGESITMVRQLQSEIGRDINIGANMNYQQMTLADGRELVQASLIWNRESNALTGLRRLRGVATYYTSIPFMVFSWSLHTYSAKSTR